MKQEILLYNQDEASLSKEKNDNAKNATGEICSNCGVILNGMYCHACGQSSKSVIKFFGDVIKELVDDAVGYDSRMKHSVFPLLFKPGRITLDYVKGKRFHYVLPFRLYLITSLVLILLVKSLVVADDINLDEVVDQSSEQVSEEIKTEVNQALEIARDNQTNATAKEIIKSAMIDNELTTVSDEVIEELSNEDKINLVKGTIEDKSFNVTVSEDINLKWNNEKKEFDGIDGLDEGLVKTFFVEINPKLKQWLKDPEPLIDSFFEALPYMMFIILPIFALFLKLFYAFSKRFYTEHLIFLLHNHSFIYLVLMLQVVLDFFVVKLNPMQSGLAQTASSIMSLVSTISSYWIVIYVFIAMKRFYRQGWGMTITKSFALGSIYLMMLSFGFMMTIAIGAYQA